MAKDLPKTESAPAALIADEQTNSALQKAFAVLEVLVRSPAPLSATDLEVQLGTPKTSILRTLSQLEANGLVLRASEQRRYRVGGRLTSFAIDVLTASTRLSRPHLVLRDLVEEIGESCNLGVLSGLNVVYIDRVECRWPLRSQMHPGTLAPVHCTGIGKLLLAQLPASVRERMLENLQLERRTSRTITTLVALERELSRIVSQGYAVNDQENIEGMIALAVPVRNLDGRIVAGLALEAPVARLDIPGARKLLPKLRRAASEIGSILGEE